jgi:hypothetical protein
MILPQDISWFFESSVRELFRSVTKNEQFYDDLIEALEIELCKYFNSDAACMRKAASISPIKGASVGGKGLKMRLGYPGCGKRGGLRLAVEAVCSSQRVNVVGAWVRKDDPGDDEFAGAFDAARGH